MTLFHFLTIWIVRLAEVQVVAGPGRIVLGAHGELHALNVLFEVVQRSKDVFHSLHAVISDGLVSLHLGVTLVLPGALNGQRLDDVPRRTLQRRQVQRHQPDLLSLCSLLIEEKKMIQITAVSRLFFFNSNNLSNSNRDYSQLTMTIQ